MGRLIAVTGVTSIASPNEAPATRMLPRNQEATAIRDQRARDHVDLGQDSAAQVRVNREDQQRRDGRHVPARAQAPRDEERCGAAGGREREAHEIGAALDAERQDAIGHDAAQDVAHVRGPNADEPALDLVVIDGAIPVLEGVAHEPHVKQQHERREHPGRSRPGAYPRGATHRQGAAGQRSASGRTCAA